MDKINFKTGFQGYEGDPRNVGRRAEEVTGAPMLKRSDLAGATTTMTKAGIDSTGQSVYSPFVLENTFVTSSWVS